MPRSDPRKTDEQILARILADVLPDGDGCWIYQKALTSAGYAKTNYRGRTVGMHRLVYALTHPQFDAAMSVDHACHNRTGCAGGPTCKHRACLNPEHLEEVPIVENALRSHNHPGNRTSCDQGHPLQRDSRGRRMCPRCKAQYKRDVRDGVRSPKQKETTK